MTSRGKIDKIVKATPDSIKVFWFMIGLMAWIALAFTIGQIPLLTKNLIIDIPAIVISAIMLIIALWVSIYALIEIGKTPPKQEVDTDE